jgi:hypothetical protein
LIPGFFAEIDRPQRLPPGSGSGGCAGSSLYFGIMHISQLQHPVSDVLRDFLGWVFDFHIIYLILLPMREIMVKLAGKGGLPANWV